MNLPNQPAFCLSERSKCCRKPITMRRSILRLFAAFLLFVTSISDGAVLVTTGTSGSNQTITFDAMKFDFITSNAMYSFQGEVWLVIRNAFSTPAPSIDIDAPRDGGSLGIAQVYPYGWTTKGSVLNFESLYRLSNSIGDISTNDAILSLGAGVPFFASYGRIENDAGIWETSASLETLQFASGNYEIAIYSIIGSSSEQTVTQLTSNAVAIPEPSIYGLLGVGAVVAIAIHRKMRT